MEIKFNNGLQFITSAPSAAETARQAILSMEGGCRWVQIRMKDATTEEIIYAVEEIKPSARKFGATLILDDHVQLAKELDLSGVHLGKNDMSPIEARGILGNGRIIGATANTFDDVLKISHMPVDYIGLGPFRFTTTKKNLSPVLGLDGYRHILSEMAKTGVRLPVVAIGGITLADVESLMATGISGIAISGAISKSRDIPDSTAKFLCEINQKQI